MSNNNLPISNNQPTLLDTASLLKSMTTTPAGSYLVTPGYIRSSGTGVSIYDGNNVELVCIDSNGTVTWTNNINVDAAADALGKALVLGAEIAAGLTCTKQNKIRNTLFEEIIQVAKEEGPLDADKLAFMLRSCKIMDKLKENN